MQNIYCLQGFNNYYNRVVKNFKSIPDYIEWSKEAGDKEIKTFTNINFNPSDGVNTTHIFNWDFNWYPDYIIVEDDFGILTRWFVIDFVRTRGKQYQSTLRRDLIVDFYSSIILSPCFIEKATIDDLNNPLIFNNEDMTFNQIKQREYLIKDTSNCPWIIGYYDRNKISELNGTVPQNAIVSGAIQINEDIENWEYFQYSDLAPDRRDFPGKPTTLEYVIRTLGKLGDGSTTAAWYYFIDSNSGSVSDDDYSWSTRPSLVSKYDDGFSYIKTQIKNVVLANNKRYLNEFNSLSGNFSEITSESEFEEFYQFNGRIIRDNQGKYYQVSIVENDDTLEEDYDIAAGSLFNSLSNAVSEVAGITGEPNTDSFYIHTEQPTYSVFLVEQEQLSTTYNITANALVTTDAPWNIFAIPYGKIEFDDPDAESVIETSKDIGLATAMAMQAQHPGVIYDIQLLPYCPVFELISDGKIVVDDVSQFSYIKDEASDTNVGIILNVPKSNFTNNIFINIPSANNAYDKKINNECDKWRLSSPNYSNYFDFSLEKNGDIYYFNIDCHYKPFNPYIHINPNFGNLYGYDDNSPRGLVLGGDFSLTQIIDQWEQYQIQNKNFQSIFDRQIQNMEINNKYQRRQDILNAITGTASGAVGGGFLGSNFGNIGAGIAIGGGISGLAGIEDVKMKDKLRNEAIDFTKDQFGYQLGNIQALPQTISKVSAFNENNKIFPVLEFYTCKEVEKNALKDKIKWNGMTVMVIGKISDYLNPQYNFIELSDGSRKSYIKGKIINFVDIDEDFHILNEIASEINKGVYI